MFIALAFMFAGIGIGYVFRKHKIKAIHRVITALIWLLLLLLGLNLGADKNIVSQSAQIGLEAFLLATAGVLGSVFFAWLLWKTVKK